MKRGLIIFAREPVPGAVKTRLARDVGDRAAAGIYAAMLTDVLEKVAALDDVRPLLFWALETGVFPDISVLPDLETFEQHGRDLGERMANAFQCAFASGVETCCIIGTDSPDLPAGYILQAFELLERDAADVVFGPAADGGYYLLGLRHTPQRLFDGIPWSTATVLNTSLERAAILGLRSALLPPWHDIDTLDDLKMLMRSPGAEQLRTCSTFQHLLNEQGLHNIVADTLVTGTCNEEQFS